MWLMGMTYLKRAINSPGAHMTHVEEFNPDNGLEAAIAKVTSSLVNDMRKEGYDAREYRITLDIQSLRPLGYRKPEE